MPRPVARSWEVITALPNGYFGGDLNPFEIAVFAQIIEKQFSYQLFGIGADLLGFVRLGDTNPEQAATFADFLMHTFEIGLASANDEDADHPINWRAYFAPQIIDCLLNQDVVFISYTENDFENWREDLDLRDIV